MDIPIRRRFLIATIEYHKYATVTKKRPALKVFYIALSPLIEYRIRIPRRFGRTAITTGASTATALLLSRHNGDGMKCGSEIEQWR